jgi:hypothetical protein
MTVSLIKTFLYYIIIVQIANKVGLKKIRLEGQAEQETRAEASVFANPYFTGFLFRPLMRKIETSLFLQTNLQSSRTKYNEKAINYILNRCIYIYIDSKGHTQLAKSSYGYRPETVELSSPPFLNL